MEDPYPHAKNLAYMIQEMLKQRFQDKNVINYANVSDLYYDWAEHLKGLSPKDRPWFY